MADNSALASMTLNSTREEILRVKEFTNKLNQLLSLDEELVNNMVLALSEAATNAVVHGNKEDESKKVSLQAWADDTRVLISVQDEGEGFDPDALPDPLEDENLLKEGGRGVFLMRQYADHVEYSEGGSKVTLTFNLE